VVRGDAGGLAYDGDPRGPCTREPGVLERACRILVDQPARGHQVARHALGRIALQAPQVASHLGVELGGRDVVGQGRLAHPGRHRTLGAGPPGPAVGSVLPGRWPVGAAARPVLGGRISALVAGTAVGASLGAPVAPVTAFVAAVRTIMTIMTVGPAGVTFGTAAGAEPALLRAAAVAAGAIRAPITAGAALRPALPVSAVRPRPLGRWTPFAPGAVVSPAPRVPVVRATGATFRAPVVPPCAPLRAVVPAGAVGAADVLAASAARAGSAALRAVRAVAALRTTRSA
jgi:hypothetical protein